MRQLLLRCLRWFNLPGAILVTLLQRTPVQRVATVVEGWVGASPLGAVLRSAITATASLGALHSLAGATQLTASKVSPLQATVGVAIPTVAMTVTGAQTVPGSFRVTGPIPPGLSISGLTGVGGSVNTATLAMIGTPTTAGTFAMTLRAWADPNLKGDSSSNFIYTVIVTGGTNTIPAITTQPLSQTVVVGATVTFTAAASGSPSPTFQWRKDGVDIAGATSATLTLSNVPATAAGVYSVTATNVAGSTASNAVTLFVTTPAPGVALPVFTAQPAPQTIAAGSTVVLAATVTGATSFQWSHNGAPLSGATGAMLILTSTTDADAGTYTLAATNTTGTVTSAAATLAVTTVAVTDAGRLINLSILTTASSGAKALTMGATIGGNGTAGALPLVIRAVGPTLGQAPFNIPGVLPDPVMVLNAAGNPTPLSSNDNWGGGTTMTAAFGRVGAFALLATSLDSAIVPLTPGLASGGYTVTVTDKTGTSGLVIAEIYDAAGTARTATTPRLTNLSTLTQIDAGANLAVGFVLGGTTARTVLVRGIGPTLGSAFSIQGVMTDPKLELFNNATGQKIMENNDWGGDTALASSSASVGAFPLASGATKDAVLLVTLPPGQYSARVSGADGGGGTAIVEVYEVP